MLRPASRLRRRPAFALARLARQLVAPLVVAVVPLYWVVDATNRASLATLGRDQGIFQYIAWAVRRGDVDYRDIRDVNGPLIHMIHMALLALGGADEHRFHVLELAGTGLAFAAVGACLPGLVVRRVRGLERVAWAFAGWVVLSAQYHLYLYWNQAQRESFCDWFLLPSLALHLLPGRPGRRVVWIAGLSTVTWFGKPSFALFTVVQLTLLLLEPHAERRAILKRFAVGALAGAAGPLLYLVVFGDPIAFLKITFIDVPRVYRFIWAKSAPEILGEEGPLGATTVGLATSAVLVGLVALRELPRRALALALGPPCALVSVLVQHKGFGYHFHPMTATSHAGMLVVVVMLWERFRGAPRRARLGRLVAVLGAATLGLFVASSMRASPHTRNVWILAGGETPARRQEQEYFDSFKSYDFFPWEMRQAAAYLARVTDENARVQTYGMDPYVLFLAKRRSATPYIYAYDLDDDAALDGGWSNRPSDAQIATIKATRDAHERDLLARLGRAPPEVFLFVDESPLMTYHDAWEDFRHCCKDASTFVASRYHPARSWGALHVWVRDDLVDRIPDIERGGVP